MRVILLHVALLTLLLAGCQTPPMPVATEHLNHRSDPRQAVAEEIPDIVQATPFIPPGHPQEERYTIVVFDVPVREVLFTLMRNSRISADIHPSVDGNVTLNAVEQTLPAILETISRQVDMVYELNGKTLIIKQDQAYWHTYKVDYLNMKRKSTGSMKLSLEGGGEGISTSGDANVSADFDMDFWDPIADGIKKIIKVDNAMLAKGKVTSSAPLKSSQESGEADDGSKKGKDTEKDKGKEKEKDAGKSEDETFVLHKATGVISVSATKRQHKQIQEFLDRIIASANLQVLIEATVVEVALTDDFAQGVDWSRVVGGGSGTNIGIGNLPVFAVSGNNSLELNHVLKTGENAINEIAASVKLLSQFGNVSVLSSPKVVAMNNQTAVMKVANEIIYFAIERTSKSNKDTVATDSTLSTAVLITQSKATVKKVMDGLLLAVTPNISDSGVVSLHVRPTLSQLIGYVKDPSTDDTGRQVNNLVPQMQVREFDSILRIPSGQVVILGGLMKDSSASEKNNVPGMGDIPFVRSLFGHETQTLKKTEMAIFIRPTIMTPDTMRERLDQIQFSLGSGTGRGDGVATTPALD